MTQFGRGLYELNIDLICANSCQAKGRVERANQTLQDRLVKELRLRGICTIEDANAFMEEFVQEYNNRFAKVPLLPGDAHRPLQPYDDVEEALCFKQERTVSHNVTVQHDRIKYLIEDIPENRVLKRQQILIYEYPDGSVSLYAKGRKLKFRKLFDRVGCPIQGTVVESDRLAAVLAYIQSDQEERTIQRSQSSLSKRHVGIMLIPKIN